MNKEEVVEFMLDSINTDNRDMCERNGMSKEETELSIEQSQHSLGYMLENLYDRMKEANIIA
jgi:hypothetical protein